MFFKKNFSRNVLLLTILGVLLLFSSCNEAGSDLTAESDSVSDSATESFATSDSATEDPFVSDSATETSSPNDNRIEISPVDKSLAELATVIYNETQLAAIARLDIPIQVLHAIYPIECIREFNYAHTLYRVSYLGDESIAVVWFSETGEKIMGKVYDAPHLKAYFDGLAIGCTIDEVQAFDPDGHYHFLYAGTNLIPQESYHYTKDGYLITVEYEYDSAIEHLIITNIREELI